MSFNVIRENKILGKISKSTVVQAHRNGPSIVF